MDYTQLDMEHKRAFMMNLNTISSAAVMLSKLLQEPVEVISEVLAAEAERTINELTDEQVSKYIDEIERHHKGTGGILYQEKEH